MIQCDMYRWLLTVCMSTVVSAVAAQSDTPSARHAAADGRERSINAAVVVPAKRAEVWKALTTTEGATTFFAPAANIELRAGGPYEIYFIPDAPAGSRGGEGCRVLSFVPERMLSISWNAPMKFLERRGGRTFVVFELADTEDGHTKVTLTNGGYGHGPKWDDTFTYFSNAWPSVLENLKKRFEDGPRFSEDQKKTVDASRRGTFIYILHPVRPDMDTKPTKKEIDAVNDHWQYLLTLLAKNQLVLAGRTGMTVDTPNESSGMVPLDLPDGMGLVVFQAKDAAEAREIMENDPAVARGVFKARVQPYGLALIRP